LDPQVAKRDENATFTKQQEYLNSLVKEGFLPLKPHHIDGQIRQDTFFSKTLLNTEGGW
jgi:hypothetical protein